MTILEYKQDSECCNSDRGWVAFAFSQCSPAMALRNFVEKEGKKKFSCFKNPAPMIKDMISKIKSSSDFADCFVFEPEKIRARAIPEDTKY